MRQARGVSGLARNVENVLEQRPSKAWVDGSNPSGRTIKLLIYIDFILKHFLPTNAEGHMRAKFAPFYHFTQHLRAMFG